MKNTRYKLLLVEDDKVDQIAFKQLIRKENLPYDCTIAGSASEAIGILRSERFDIIIADYLLGDGTAFDILDSEKNVPVIFVTGAGDEEVAVKAMKSGAYDYLIKDHDRNYLKTVSITIDNAVKHKRTEEKMLLLSHAITSTDDSVFITDMDNKIIFVNRAFCETYGYDEEEIIEKDSNILYEESHVDTDGKNVCRAVDGWESGFYHRRKDGTEFPVSLSLSVVKDENGKEIALLGVARDISQLVFVESKLRHINLELKQGNRAMNPLL